MSAERPRRQCGSAVLPWRRMLVDILWDARRGVLEPDWRHVRLSAALADREIVLPPFAAAGPLRVAAPGEKLLLRGGGEEYFGLLEVAHSEDSWLWEPAASCRWDQALGAWYATSLACINGEDAELISAFEASRAAHCYVSCIGDLAWGAGDWCVSNEWPESSSMAVGASEEVQRHRLVVERDRVTEWYEAGLCAGGWAELDWVARACARVSRWGFRRDREEHLQELETAEYRSRLEQLPKYWTAAG